MPNCSKSELKCEQHFKKNTTRLSDGRFCVKLPLIDTTDCLGNSYNLAKKRLYNLEKRFRKDTDFKQQYSQFIQEYAELGHLAISSVSRPIVNYYLCHHAVFKADSESTKFRVVFDGSAPTSSGFSLNDILIVGPTVQDSLFSILVRARQYKYLLTADIEKMYRQIYVAEEDRDLQLILWREDESQPIKTLRLNTLTYGTASASYLSTRCVWQVGEECKDKAIKTIIQKDFYIDDLITGSNSEKQLKYIQESVSSELNKACFHLRKYKTNLPSIFNNSKLTDNENLTISESSSTLGLGWNPYNDNLHFPITLPNTNLHATKRSIMSNAFKIFDPLGLLSPCVIIPKILLQNIWQLKLDWDEPVPSNIYAIWKGFVDSLPILTRLEIPRAVICDAPTSVEIHAFSDASQAAYGSCVYVKSTNVNNKVLVKLLCAKSKVAPLKPTTIPRLELCAALLSARLCTSVVKAIRYKPDRIIYWSDSSVVLGWLGGSSNKLKTFVANRVGSILEKTGPSTWHYVPTASNPADLISRGVNATQLIKSNLWWSGPSFLYFDDSLWPVLKTNHDVDMTENKVILSTILQTSIIEWKRFSKFTRIRRTMAYVLRFIYNIKNAKYKQVGKLTLDELNKSFLLLCKLSQQESFPKDYINIIKQTPISPKSKLLALSPFLSNENIIRVGGRIEASNCSYERKHPILLDSSHDLCKLIFAYEHIRSMHAGPQSLLAIVRDTIWPINGRHLARLTVYKCVRCRRAQGKTLTPKMGDLPSQRVNPGFPFISVGVDFAGPFYILNRRGRGAKIIKCYMCIFVCLRYKCTHLEVASDLTKDCFIMTLRRFISRRGRPAEVFCDNGRNFTASSKEIASFLSNHTDTISDFATQEGFKFIFIPSYAPHFGGIWEAGVKSAKFHIKRVMGNSHLTFEELSTLFAQVEAILNSRPLCPLSSSPNDYLCLSPGHFLIGRQLTALPSPNLLNAKENSLQRHARLEQIRQHFWQKWQNEYISELQLRTKWKTNKDKLKVGDLVLIKENSLPPLCWRLGRVAKLFPGADGISRVADINTTRGCIRRPFVRLCPLPNQEDLQD